MRGCFLKHAVLVAAGFVAPPAAAAAGFAAGFAAAAAAVPTHPSPRTPRGKEQEGVLEGEEVGGKYLQ